MRLGMRLRTDVLFLYIVSEPRREYDFTNYFHWTEFCLLFLLATVDNSTIVGIDGTCVAQRINVSNIQLSGKV